MAKKSKKTDYELTLEEKVDHLTRKLREVKDEPPARIASALETIATEMTAMRQLFEPTMLIVNVALKEAIGEVLNEDAIIRALRAATKKGA